MLFDLHVIKHHLTQDELRLSLRELMIGLHYGDKHLYNQLIVTKGALTTLEQDGGNKMSSINVAHSRRMIRAELLDIANNITTACKSFIEYSLQAERAFLRGAWEEAIEAYKVCITHKKDDYRFSLNAINHKGFLAQANLFFTQQDWEKALNKYEDAETTFDREFSPQFELIADRISICRRSIQVEESVDNARKLMAKGDYEGAIIGFEAAKKYNEFLIQKSIEIHAVRDISALIFQCAKRQSQRDFDELIQKAERMLKERDWEAAIVYYKSAAISWKAGCFPQPADIQFWLCVCKLNSAMGRQNWHEAWKIHNEQLARLHLPSSCNDGEYALLERGKSTSFEQGELFAHNHQYKEGRRTFELSKWYDGCLKSLLINYTGEPNEQDIHKRIEFCREQNRIQVGTLAERFEVQIEKAQRAYENQDWEEALAAYSKALSFSYPHQSISTGEIEIRIVECNEKYVSSQMQKHKGLFGTFLRFKTLEYPSWWSTKNRTKKVNKQVLASIIATISSWKNTIWDQLKLFFSRKKEITFSIPWQTYTKSLATGLLGVFLVVKNGTSSVGKWSSVQLSNISAEVKTKLSSWKIIPSKYIAYSTMGLLTLAAIWGVLNSGIISWNNERDKNNTFVVQEDTIINSSTIKDVAGANPQLTNIPPVDVEDSVADQLDPPKPRPSKNLICGIIDPAKVNFISGQINLNPAIRSTRSITSDDLRQLNEKIEQLLVGLLPQNSNVTIKPWGSVYHFFTGMTESQKKNHQTCPTYLGAQLKSEHSIQLTINSASNNNYQLTLDLYNNKTGKLVTNKSLTLAKDKVKKIITSTDQSENTHQRLLNALENIKAKLN